MADRQARTAAQTYRGWRYVVYQVSRFAWDVDHTEPGDRLTSDHIFSPFYAKTAKRAERKFRRYVDQDIAHRIERVARDRALYGPDVRLLPGDEPTAEELSRV
jgi:hypothetical protein